MPVTSAGVTAPNPGPQKTTSAEDQAPNGRPRKSRSAKDQRKVNILRGLPPETPVPTRTKIARDLEKSDGRPECPNHGPKGTMIFKGATRFVCCGLVVPGSTPEPRPWYER